MENQFVRTQMLFGKDAMEKLSHSKVAIFGIGGVGGYTAEALARSGVGELHLIDNDTVCLSNLNRQIIATHSTLGMKKVDAAKARLIDINPNIKVVTHDIFFLPENSDCIDFSVFDYVVDAIDTVSGKIALVEIATQCHIPIISSMGAGNKLNPQMLEVTDIYKTSVCPLARVMRRELKNRNIKKLKVVYSKEKAMTPIDLSEDNCDNQRRQVPGSNAFVPSVAGLIIAAEVIKDITGIRND